MRKWDSIYVTSPEPIESARACRRQYSDRVPEALMVYVDRETWPAVERLSRENSGQRPGSG